MRIYEKHRIDTLINGVWGAMGKYQITHEDGTTEEATGRQAIEKLVRLTEYGASLRQRQAAGAQARREKSRSDQRMARLSHIRSQYGDAAAIVVSQAYYRVGDGKKAKLYVGDRRMSRVLIDVGFSVTDTSKICQSFRHAIEAS